MDRYLHLLFVVLFSILGQPVFSAQNVFVIGSFKSSEAAHTEASRISEELGAELIIKEVLIDSVIFHRLLIPYPTDPNLEKELSRELVFLGVKDIWRSKIDLNEDGQLYQSGNQSKQKVWNWAKDNWKTENLIASENEIYQLVAGSFKQESKADEFAEELRNWGEDVKVEDADIVGKTFYRVVSGPLLQSDALLKKKQLVDSGVSSPWLLRYEDTFSGPKSVSLEEKGLETMEIDSASIKKTRIKSSSESLVSEIAETEYNLAKLKKK